MTAAELLKSEDELSFLLSNLGPVEFIRTLILNSSGSQVLAQESTPLQGGGSRTRFLFIDIDGAQAELHLETRLGPGGAPAYGLSVRPGPR